jgi:uncharacterized membrane protein
MDASRLYVLGFVILFAGVALLFIGDASSSSESFGGVVFIGPIPFVFGTGPEAGILTLTAVIIAVAMILMFYLSIILSRRGRSSGQT